MEGIALLFKVIWSPGEAMLRATKRASTAFAPVLLLSLAGIAVTVFMFSRINMADMTFRALEQRRGAQQLTQEQKDRIIQTSNSSFAKAFTLIASAVGPALSIACVALIYFAIFTLVGRNGLYRAFFAITAFAFVPLLIRHIAVAITVSVVPQSSLQVDEIGSISPAIFLDRGAVSPALFTIFNQLDIVSLWILTLLVIGFRFVVPRDVSTTTRTACVFGLWFVWVALKVATRSIFPA
jgi:hypothetical protein